MKLSNQELFNEFYKLNKDKYPDVTFEQMQTVVFYPWLHFKNLMKAGNLVSMRFKYLGIFTIYTGKVQSELRKITELFKEGKMLDKDYFRIKVHLEKYLSNEKN